MNSKLTSVLCLVRHEQVVFESIRGIQLHLHLPLLKHSSPQPPHSYRRQTERYYGHQLLWNYGRALRADRDPKTNDYQFVLHSLAYLLKSFSMILKIFIKLSLLFVNETNLMIWLFIVRTYSYWLTIFGSDYWSS